MVHRFPADSLYPGTSEAPLGPNTTSSRWSVSSPRRWMSAYRYSVFTLLQLEPRSGCGTPVLGAVTTSCGFSSAPTAASRLL
jgi:hypothetical protein